MEKWSKYASIKETRKIVSNRSGERLASFSQIWLVEPTGYVVPQWIVFLWHVQLTRLLETTKDQINWSTFVLSKLRLLLHIWSNKANRWFFFNQWILLISSWGVHDYNPTMEIIYIENISQCMEGMFQMHWDVFLSWIFSILRLLSCALGQSLAKPLIYL